MFLLREGKPSSGSHCNTYTLAVSKQYTMQNLLSEIKTLVILLTIASPWCLASICFLLMLESSYFERQGGRSVERKHRITWLIASGLWIFHTVPPPALFHRLHRQSSALAPRGHKQTVLTGGYTQANLWDYIWFMSSQKQHSLTVSRSQSFFSFFFLQAI